MAGVGEGMGKWALLLVVEIETAETGEHPACPSQKAEGEWCVHTHWNPSSL